MTGRIYVVARGKPLARHTSIELPLDRGRLVFEDPRYFGRLTLDTSPIGSLGVEPLEDDFNLRFIKQQFCHSRIAVKPRLMDQSVVAGIGNLYASEALFSARLHPWKKAKHLTPPEQRRLHTAIRTVLSNAIRFGSTIPLDWQGASSGSRHRLFYYGTSSARSQPTVKERLFVYDRSGKPCLRCGTPIRRRVQAQRSTFFCPSCQKR
jgi:formamidopyrimidine-DNA glycosylase